MKALGGKNHVEASTNVKSDAYNMRREGMGSDNQNAAKSMKAMLKSGKGLCKKDKKHLNLNGFYNDITFLIQNWIQLLAPRVPLAKIVAAQSGCHRMTMTKLRTR